MHKFDYSFIKESVPGSIVGTTNLIADLNAKEDFRKLQYAETFCAIRKQAIIESIRSSNEIEGIVTTAERFDMIMQGATPLTHTEKEILGYKKALEYVVENYDKTELSVELVRELHRLIYDETAPETAGTFKKQNNYIIESDADGNRKVRFRPVSAKKTPEAISQWLLAFYEARQDYGIPALLLIPCVVFDFLCIHPFADGNGRVSRLLTLFLLLQSGCDIGLYISIENQINNYRETYYEKLAESSEGWNENTNDYLPFVIYSLQILYRCYKDLDDRFTEISLQKASKNKRIEAVLSNAYSPISKAEIAYKLPDISIKNIETVLAKLLKDGKIEKIGTYKNARYIRKG